MTILSEIHFSLDADKYEGVSGMDNHLDLSYHGGSVQGETCTYWPIDKSDKIHKIKVGYDSVY